MNKLKNRRLQIGLTQVQVGSKAQLAERDYRRYEADERTPNVRTAIRIAKALNTTVEELWSNEKVT